MTISNIIITSNIYPRKGQIYNDKKFIKQINNRLALEKLKKSYGLNENDDLTSFQKKIYENELMKCVLNKPGDITWGIISENNKLSWKCRCEELDCKFLKKCRPNIEESEIKDILFRKDQHLYQISQKELKNNKKNEMEIEFNQTLIDFRERENILTEEIKIKEKISLDSEKNKNVRVVEIIKKDPVKTAELESKAQLEIEIKKEKILDVFEESETQNTVIRYPSTQKILIDAPPGTGKTYTLIERIKYLILEEKIKPDEIIVLSFSRSAIAEINNRIKMSIEDNESDWDLDKVDIRTFDSFATYIIKAVDSESIPTLFKKDYDERIELCIKLIENNPGLFQYTKHLIVDEIQDLVGIRARLVQALIKNINSGFTLLGDLCQSIYDYQVQDKDDDFTSIKFNTWLNSEYGNLMKQHTFTKNYRQSKALISKTTKLRNSILKDNDLLQIQVAENILNEFESIGKTTELSSTFDHSNQKTAFLCRTNGQVLKLSKELYHQNINHAVQKPSTHRLLKSWLANLFHYDDALKIDYDEFEKRMINLQEKQDDIGIYWNTLKSIEETKGSYIDLENLSDELLYKQLFFDKLLIKNNNNIVVSTIHRAKGKEYDNIILLDDSLIKRYKEDQIPQEIKTCYVALTRSKKNVHKVKFNRKLYATKNKNYSNRWVSTYNWYGKAKISEIEVGKEKDINRSSFVSNKLFENENDVIENQNYIKQNIKKNDRIQLRLYEESEKAYYDIYHFNKRIGRMTDEFTDSIFKMHQIRNKNSLYLPDEINDIFVDEICSYLGDRNISNVHELYSRKKIWLGISVIGFGKKKHYSNY